MKLQANARCCFVCGMENNAGLKMRFYESETLPAVVTAEYTVPHRFQGYPGIVHGGVIAAMLDEVSSRAVMRGDPPRLVVTAQMTVRYRRPVPIETPLKLTGRVVSDTGRVVKVAGEIIGPDGTLLAEADATLMEVNQKFFGGEQPLEAADWQVYPAENSSSDGGCE